MLTKPCNNYTGSAGRRRKNYLWLFVFKNLPENILTGLREQKRKGNPCRFLLNGVLSYLYVRTQPQEREFITAQGDYHIPYKHYCTVLQHEITCSCTWGKCILSCSYYTNFHVFSLPSNWVEEFFKQLVFPYPQAHVPEQDTSEKHFFQ